jgi:hypothetical protein
MRPKRRGSLQQEGMRSSPPAGRVRGSIIAARSPGPALAAQPTVVIVIAGLFYNVCGSSGTTSVASLWMGMTRHWRSRPPTLPVIEDLGRPPGGSRPREPHAVEHPVEDDPPERLVLRRTSLVLSWPV